MAQVRRLSVDLLLLAVGGCALAWALTAERDEELKQGRIAIDTFHSDWEWTDVPLDRQTFGSKTTYSFRSLVVLLQQYFQRVDEIEEGPLTLEQLQNYDVWILKTPTSPFLASEIDAIHAYIREGGGVWLVGDHTNVFGMNTYLNQVCQKFGITYQSDAAVPYQRSGGRQLWTRGVRRHPIMRDIPEFFFLTSCTLRVDPLRTRPVIVGRGLFSDAADYSQMTFFGDLKRDTKEPYGLFVQCASVEYGKGRLVAFSDSTPLSSFAILLPGRWELAVNTVSWLNRQTHTPTVRHFVSAGMAALVLLGGVVAGLRGKPARAIGYWVLVGALSCLAVQRAIRFLTDDVRPEPRWTKPVVGFVVSDLGALPIRESTPHSESSPSSFDTFFVWIQRNEMLPFVFESLTQTVKYGKAVYLDLSNRFGDPHVVEGLRVLLLNGGRAWVLTSDANAAKQALALIDPVRRWSVLPVSQDGGERIRVLHRTTGKWLSIPRPGYVIQGINAIVETEDGGAVIGWVDNGEARLIICSSPSMFSNAEMGGVTQIPTTERFDLYEVQWECLDHLCGS